MNGTIQSKNQPCQSDRESLPNLPKVVQVMKSLAKLVSGKKIYADNNPRLAKFREEFHNKLHAYFEDETELILLIEQTAVKWEDRVVYQNDKMDDSLAFLLYRDGIGEVTFEKDITSDEIDRFADVLTKEFHNREEDEDIVTKFWKADFRYITYRVLEDYLSSEFGDGADMRKVGESSESGLDCADHEEDLPSLEDKGRVIIESTDPIGTIDAYFANIVSRTSPSQEPAVLEQTFQNILANTLKVNENELTQCQDELRVETGSEPLVAFLESILSFTLLTQNPTAVRDVLNVSTRLVDFVVDEGRVKAIMGMHSLLSDFMKGANIPENIVVTCDEYRNKLTSDDLLLALTKNIEQWNEKTAETLEFFSQMGEKSVPHLCTLLQSIKGQKAHQGVCDAILVIAGDDILSTLDFLDIENADIACDLVYLMRKAGVTTITAKIKELIHYPDPRVKMETIKYLKEIDDESAAPLLFKILSDPDKLIRIKCLEAIEGMNHPEVLRKISALAFSKDLAEGDLDEQEAVFKVLGHIGTNETVELIKNMLGKRRLLNFGKNRENKFLAIWALENICTPESLVVLDKLASDSNNLVQSRACRARDSMEKRLLASAEGQQKGTGRND